MGRGQKGMIKKIAQGWQAATVHGVDVQCLYHQKCKEQKYHIFCSLRRIFGVCLPE